MTTSYLYDYYTKYFYKYITKVIWPDWVHPNYITLLGGIFAILCSYCLLLLCNTTKNDGASTSSTSDDSSSSSSYSSSSSLLLFISCISFICYYLCDCMDGEHARLTKQCSKFGGFLDHVIDGIVGNYAGYNTISLLVLGILNVNDEFVFS